MCYLRTSGSLSRSCLSCDSNAVSQSYSNKSENSEDFKLINGLNIYGSLIRIQPAQGEKGEKLKTGNCGTRTQGV